MPRLAMRPQQGRFPDESPVEVRYPRSTQEERNAAWHIAEALTLPFPALGCSGFGFGIADLRELPLADASLAGVVCWYSLMYLAPSDRPAAFSELARVIKPGGYLVTAFKAGDSQVRRGGRSTGLGVAFDVYWLSPDEVERRAAGALRCEERVCLGLFVERLGGRSMPSAHTRVPACQRQKLERDRRFARSGTRSLIIAS